MLYQNRLFYISLRGCLWLTVFGAVGCSGAVRPFGEEATDATSVGDEPTITEIDRETVAGDEALSKEDGGLADDGGPNEDGAVSEDGPGYPFSSIRVTWVPCSFIEGANDGLGECASTEMPLHWEKPEGATFTVGAKRRRSSAANPTAQLWFLHGGPGASGVKDLPPMMQKLQDAYPELDVYTLDPRGTGTSEYLGCPDQESSASAGGANITDGEVDACIAYLKRTYGDRLDLFGTTPAAIDLAAYIHATHQAGLKVFIWGGSGGTFWGQRYLQLFPNQADGLILEGNEPPDGSLVFQDEAHDKVGRGILSLCSQDSFCKAKLPDPLAFLSQLETRLDQGFCSALSLNAGSLKQVLVQLAYYSPYHDTIPAFLYRINRCNSADQTAIDHLFSVLFGGEDPPGVMSQVLYFNEVYSELWAHKRFADNAALVQYLDQLYTGGSLFMTYGAYYQNNLYLKWPRYQDPLDDTWPITNVPLLILQGLLDPATPHEQALSMAAHYTQPLQTFVTFPYAAHNAVSGSQVSRDKAVPSCGLSLWIKFMKQPQVELDRSCASQTLAPDFEGKQWGNTFFGTVDYWQNIQPAPGLGSLVGPDHLPEMYRPVERALARALRRSAPELAERYRTGRQDVGR